MRKKTPPMDILLSTPSIKKDIQSKTNKKKNSIKTKSTSKSKERDDHDDDNESDYDDDDYEPDESESASSGNSQESEDDIESDKDDEENLSESGIILLVREYQNVMYKDENNYEILGSHSSWFYLSFCTPTKELLLFC